MWKVVFIVCSLQGTDCKAVEYPVEGDLGTAWACMNAGQTSAVEYLKNRKNLKVTKWSCQKELPHEIEL